MKINKYKNKQLNLTVIEILNNEENEVNYINIKGKFKINRNNKFKRI